MAEKNDELNCSICLNGFKKPKLLECIHTFCESCLSDYISKFEENGTFKCPLCRKAIKIPEGGVSQFAGNIYVTDNFQETDDSPAKTPSCDACKKDVESEFQCIDCDQFLCGSCKITHDSFAGCIKHDVVRLSDITNTEEPTEIIPIICQQHGKKFAVFCMNCSLVICSKCSQKNHSTHDVQKISEIGEAIDKAKRELGDITGDFKTKLPGLYKVKSAIISQVSILKRSMDEACKHIDKRVNEVCSAVHKQGEKLKATLKAVHNEQEYPITSMQGDLNNLITKLESRCKQMSDDVVKYDSVDVLTVLPDFKDKLDDIRRQPLAVPLVKLPQVKYDILDETSLFNEIGLLDVPLVETIDFSFNVNECLKSTSNAKVYSVNCVIEGCTLYLSLYETNKCLIIQILSVNKFPSSLPSLAIVNKDKAKSIINATYNQYKQFVWENAPGKLTKARGFINVHNNLTITLTRQ